MKLLLDESLPRQLGEFFPDAFEVRTAQRMGWAGSKNGDGRAAASARPPAAETTASKSVH